MKSIQRSHKKISLFCPRRLKNAVRGNHRMGVAARARFGPAGIWPFFSALTKIGDWNIRMKIYIKRYFHRPPGQSGSPRWKTTQKSSKTAANTVLGKKTKAIKNITRILPDYCQNTDQSTTIIRPEYDQIAIKELLEYDPVYLPEILPEYTRILQEYDRKYCQRTTRIPKYH